jgi:hypothetical protein
MCPVFLTKKWTDKNAMFGNHTGKNYLSEIHTLQCLRIIQGKMPYVSETNM